MFYCYCFMRLPNYVSSSFSDFTLQSIGQIPDRVWQVAQLTRIIEMASAALLEWAPFQNNWEIIVAIFIIHPGSSSFVIRYMCIHSLLSQSTPKLSSLMQHHFVSSQVLGMRNPAPLSGILCSRVSHKAAIQGSVRAGVSSKGQNEEGSTSEFM